MPVPDAVCVAQSVVAGKEPGSLFWSLKPHRGVLEDDCGCKDTYLEPRRFLQDEWGLDYLSVVAPQNLETERGIESNPAYQARVLEHALLDALRMLNSIAEDGLRRMKQPFEPPRFTSNERLRARIATAVHDELAELLRNWGGLEEHGAVPVPRGMRQV